MMVEAIDPDWWRGYRGCQSPAPEEDGEEIVIFRGGNVDDEIDPKRGLPLELGYPAPTARAAIKGVRSYLDILVDACGPNQLYIRSANFRATGSGKVMDAWVAVARIIVIPERVVN